MREVEVVRHTESTIHHVIASDVSEVDAVCRSTLTLLDGKGLARKGFTVELLLREFLNNAIFHGHGSDRNKLIKVTVRIGRKWIMLKIADEGPGFAWWSLDRLPPPEIAESGRGLAIGEHYAQRMQFNRTGNQVTLWVRKTD